MKKLLITLLILSLLMVCAVPCYSQGGRDYQARVLTVSKWIDLSGRWFNRTVIPFADGGTTPSVYSSNSFKTANTAPTTITTFDDSRIGQWIAILFTDANTTIDFSGTNLFGNSGVDWTSSIGSVLYATYDGTNWYCMVSNVSASGGDITITGVDPAIIFDGSTAGDTDFWMGITADEVGDDNDLFQIGTGTTKGTNPYFTMDENGYMALGTAHSPDNIFCIRPSGILGFTMHESDSDTNKAISMLAGATGGVFQLHQNNIVRTQLNGASDSYFNVGNSMDVGFNTNSPDRTVEILHASDPQERWTHTDNTNYGEVQADANGDLTFTVSGDEVKLPQITVMGAGTKHDGFTVRDAAEVQTTDATVTVLDSITLLEGNTYLVEAWVTATQSDESARAVYKIITGAKRTTAGAAALFGSVVSIITSEEEASWACTFTVSGNDLRVSVTGEAATTIDWTCTKLLINGSI